MMKWLLSSLVKLKCFDMPCFNNVFLQLLFTQRQMSPQRLLLSSCEVIDFFKRD